MGRPNHPSGDLNIGAWSVKDPAISLMAASYDALIVDSEDASLGRSERSRQAHPLSLIHI